MCEKNNLKDNDKKKQKKVDHLSLGIFFAFGTVFVLLFGAFPSRFQNSQSVNMGFAERLFFAIIFLILSVIFFYKHKKSKRK